MANPYQIGIELAMASNHAGCKIQPTCGGFEGQISTGALDLF
jgi:hypothetical protein